MTWAIEKKGYSQRRACGLIGLEPKMYRYVSTRPDDAGIRSRLRALAGERRRFGYRRLLILLRREGAGLNHKKLFRLYREERLTVMVCSRETGPYGVRVLAVILLAGRSGADEGLDVHGRAEGVHSEAGR